MTVYKKKDKYYCRFQIDGERHHFLCTGAKDEREAKKLESQFMFRIQQQQNGVIPREEKNVPLYRLKKLYLEHSENNNRSHNNNIYYADILINILGANTPCQRITPNDIENLKSNLRVKRKLKNSSINRYLEILSKMFNLGIDNNLIHNNPVSKVKKLLEDNHKIRFLTTDEEKRLYEHLPKFLIPIVTCALQTGMRRGEILNLKWDNIDFDYGFIELLETKSGKSRKVPISDKLNEVLSSLDRVSEYVFVNPETNEPYVDIKKSWLKALREANIENFRFHDLRHTVATRLVEKGIDLLVVKDILGHSKIETTMRYAHPVPKRKLEAISVLNSYN